MKTVCIINYNTPELTTAAIMSLDKHTPGCKVVVFDNSDNHKPFYLYDGGHKLSNVEFYYNVRGSLINFKGMLQDFPDREPSPDNDYASFKHCYTVHCLTQILREPFILMDSDVLITQDITPLWDETQVFVGQVKPHRSRFGTVERVLPQLCFINVPMMRENGVTYYNPQKMFALSHRRPDNAYDTGAWFLEDCRNHALPYRKIDISDYCIHLGHASWKNKDAKAWLKEHEDLWHG
jgi:hypothetical protein